MDDAHAMRQCSLISVYLEATSHLEKNRGNTEIHLELLKEDNKEGFKLKTSVTSNHVNGSIYNHF